MTINISATPTHLHLATCTRVRAARVHEAHARFGLVAKDGTEVLEFIEAGDWVIGSDDETVPACERRPAIVPGIVFERCYREL